MRQLHKDQCASLSLNELLLLAHDAKQLSLTASQAYHPQSGPRPSPLLARGMEFAESRHYQPGDDIRTIDWRVTARTGKAHTKLFAAEKERPILLALDMRSPMFFATQGVFKSVQAALMAGYVAWNSAHAGDRFGGIIFDNETVTDCPSALGKKGILPFLHTLAAHTTKKDQQAPLSPSTMDKALVRLRKRATPGTLAFLISDFRYLSPQSYNGLLQLSKQCDLYLGFVYDPLEQALPKNGSYPFTDGKQTLTINTYDKQVQQMYTKKFEERRNLAVTLGQQRRIRLLECRTNDSCFDLLKNYFGR